MSYTSSYESSTTSTTTNGVEVATSTGDESSTYSTSVSATIENSSPDDSDGLYASLGGEALAVGEDTLAAGSISATLIDGGTVTSLEGSATMVAASESPEGETAAAFADTFAAVSDGAEVMFTYTVETDSTEQNPSGSTATSTSTTSIVAYDVQPADIGDQAPVLQELDGEDETLAPSEEQETSAPSSDEDMSWELDGNVAYLEFQALAVGEDTFVAVDGFVLAIEDELSLSAGLVELAVD